MKDRPKLHFASEASDFCCLDLSGKIFEARREYLCEQVWEIGLSYSGYRLSLKFYFRHSSTGYQAPLLWLPREFLWNLPERWVGLIYLRLPTSAKDISQQIRVRDRR